MAKDDLTKVGFGDESGEKPMTRVDTEGKREKEGFVGGTHIKERVSFLPIRWNPRSPGSH